LKAARKGIHTKEQLGDELSALNKKLAGKLMRAKAVSSAASDKALESRQDIQTQIQQLRQILGVEKRVKQAGALGSLPGGISSQPAEQVLSAT